METDKGGEGCSGEAARLISHEEDRKKIIRLPKHREKDYALFLHSLVSAKLN